ncbi:MAG: methyltransferase domain-containing protein [Sandaracinaceae bacterium]|jgi:SAM-dependent methyltransferase/uncharacterized protein YbaR (Trm112 family)|nr:methyltransferase domain-containing protein [Sandaracinaceae bacterium]
MTAPSAAASASAALAAALLACPSCGGKLSPFLGESETACTGCEATFPVFADVPVLMADPVAYVAEHRTAILSALAELAECTPTELATVERWARRRGATTQRLFDDDFTRPEEHGSTPSLATTDEGFLAFAHAAAQNTPLGRLLRLHGRPLGRTVEVGCGAGSESATLAAKADGLLLTDLSLRAVLLARDRASDVGKPLVGAVMDAENLALREAACESIVALHVVDVLADPFSFLEAASAALVRRGTLLLSTPNPALGLPDGPAELLDEVATGAGLEVTGRADGVPWLRVHSEREVQVFFVRLLVLLRGA